MITNRAFWPKHEAYFSGLVLAPRLIAVLPATVMPDETTILRPFLRWAGSKKQILPILSACWSQRFERYLEPFLGSGSLFFYLRPKSAILGDINTELIATYEQLQVDPNAVWGKLSTMQKNAAEYYRIRSIDVEALLPPERAARFIYLNRCAFNGIYRTNQKGEFNVPYGGERSGKLPDREWLESCSQALKAAKLVSGDFVKVLRQAQPGDFVYLDPPYSVNARRVFKEYDPTSFGASDLKRLRDWLDKLTSLNVEFLLSYAECEEADLLRADYKATRVTVRRNIAGFSGSRRNASEWLVSNRPSLAR